MSYLATFTANGAELLSDKFDTAEEAWRYLYGRQLVACPEDLSAYNMMWMAVTGEAFEGVGEDGTGVIYGAPNATDPKGHDGYEFHVTEA